MFWECCPQIWLVFDTNRNDDVKVAEGVHWVLYCMHNNWNIWSVIPNIYVNVMTKVARIIEDLENGIVDPILARLGTEDIALDMDSDGQG